nr:hypothetical protein [uncultured Enterobacter sp.]
MPSDNSALQSQIQTDLKRAKKAIDDLNRSLNDMGENTKQIARSSQNAAAGINNARTELGSLDEQILLLHSATQKIAGAFKSGLQSGMESGLLGLASGTMNLSDAFNNMAISTVEAIKKTAAHNLSEMITTGLFDLGSNMFGLFSGTAAESATGMVAGTVNDTAGALQYATAISTACTTGAMSISTSMVAAFTAGATTLTAALATAFTTGSAAMAGAISAANAGSKIAKTGASAMALFAADGGYISGPGTGTSDSIPARLSNGEYVINAASVQRYGVAFMHALNSGGLAAFSDGGLVSPPALSFPRVNTSAQLSESDNRRNLASAAPPVIQQTLVLDAAKAFTSGLNTPGGNRALLTFIHANRATLKQELS